LQSTALGASSGKSPIIDIYGAFYIPLCIDKESKEEREQRPTGEGGNVMSAQCKIRSARFPLRT
jgi:hypothetical protein